MIQTTTRLPSYGPMYAARQARHASFWMWLPMLSAGLLMIFTIGTPENPDLRPLLPEALLRNSKVFLRLSVLAIMAMMLVGLRSHPRFGRAIGYMLPFWMFVSWALVSTAWSPLRRITFGQSLFVMTLVALASVIAIKWDGRKTTSAVLLCLSLGALGCSTLLLLCHVFLPDVGAMTRNHIGLLHSTGAGATASLGLVIIVAVRLIWGWTWARRLCIPACLAHAAVLVIATNRLAVILAVGLTILLFAAFTNRAMLTATIVVFCVIVAGYLAVDPGFEFVGGNSRVVTAYAGRDQSAEELASLSGRREMWEAIWGAFTESPLIGHGYFVTSGTGELFVWSDWGNYTAHNVYLQLLATTGIIGTAILGIGVFRLICTVSAATMRGIVDWQTTAFLGTVTLWYFGWGLLNASVAGPFQPESVVFYACVGIAAGAASVASLQISNLSRGLAHDW